VPMISLNFGSLIHILFIS